METSKLALKRETFQFMKSFFKEFKPITLGLILVGSLTWTLTMVKSGLVYSYGMGFWGPNGHDGIWHIALAESLAKGSWGMPVFAGETIKNYHIGFDLLLAILHKITLIPIHILYFQVIPPILSLAIGIFAYKFVYLWSGSIKKSFWATFFIYFGGSWGFVVTLIRSGRLEGESLFWSQQSVSTLINPPFALSLLLIFAGLWTLVKGIENGSKKYLVASTFLFGVLIQVKVYAGILILFALLIAGIKRLFSDRKTDLIKVFTGVLVLSILIFAPVTRSMGETLLFRPFWFLESMMATPDRLNWQRFASALANYKLSENWIKGSLAYLIAFLIFLFGNFGTRLIGLLWFMKKRLNIRNYQYIDVLIAMIVLLGVIIPMLFIQVGTSWNTIQFFYYSLVFSGLLAGIVIPVSIKRLKVIKMYDISLYDTFIVLFIILTIPTTIGTLWYNYLPSRPPAKISVAELEALKFLAKQPDGVVLTLPFNKEAAKKAESNPPRPLYLYESTAYVSAFSRQPGYLEDVVNLEITGYDWKERRNSIENILNLTDESVLSEFLKRESIGYIYLTKNTQFNKFDILLRLSKIFENNEVVLFRVNN
ncbi:MAG: hypothetical protein US53_C0010G0007 [Candidatus Woesebacteria bacterium GW2011_GWA1_37_7]|uniref:Glycosyltransferase RgtA/B/C/D-like domain-containing protein n=1 Tax=Candidatus Woesebacteria bacterium GW2011_GWA1_37_7 TaxID=1618545 RepID=A0A0G0H6H7_9BACT|nr:MAG: hypothetical protein US53_C0010G0007 [Candidatus Woesebacteria bacterium GW2011_GWA1_37_7]